MTTASTAEPGTTRSSVRRATISSSAGPDRTGSTAGAGTTRYWLRTVHTTGIEGGPVRDRAVGDAADFAYDVESGNLVDHLHPRPLGRAQITARTVAAVHRSRARLVQLIVVVPRIRYSLTVRVSDPAAYLLHRANTVVDVMNKVTISRRVPFRRIRFAVQDGHGRTVFWWAQTQGHESKSIGLAVDPRYAGCVSQLALETGDTADDSPPPCPAR